MTTRGARSGEAVTRGVRTNRDHIRIFIRVDGAMLKPITSPSSDSRFDETPYAMTQAGDRVRPAHGNHDTPKLVVASTPEWSICIELPASPAPLLKKELYLSPWRPASAERPSSAVSSDETAPKKNAKRGQARRPPNENKFLRQLNSIPLGPDSQRFSRPGFPAPDLQATRARW